MRLLSITFALTIFFVLHANAQIELSGQIKDATTKEPLEFCTVSLLNQTDSLIGGTVTNSKGFFSLSTSGGVCRLILSFIGYKKDTTAFFYAAENKFLGVYKLKAEAKSLNEVTVSTSSYDNLVDRDVQVVTDKMKANTSTTKEVLDKMNGVELDRYSNAIKVDNSSKVIILVDGLEKDQEYIKNLSPDRLKKIEVIRDPGGRYALDGYTAVINVILKKDYKGTEIFVSGRQLTDTDTPDPDYIVAQNNASATVNYVYNKVNVYGKYSNDYNNFNLQSFARKEYSNGLVIEKTPRDKNYMNTGVRQLWHNATLGADVYLNPKHTVSFESNFSLQPSRYGTSQEHYSVQNYMNGIPAYSVPAETYSKSVSGSQSNYNTLFYVGKYNERNEFNANFTYSSYHGTALNTYEEMLMKRNESSVDDKNSTAFYAEYTHTFKNNSGIQFGYGNTWQDVTSKYTLPETSSTFKSSDTRHKLYLYYSIPLTKQLVLKAGSAVEKSNPVVNDVKKSYFILQPYADIKYQPFKFLDIKAKYRAASNYPNIGQTSPITNFIDQQSTRTGNPYLAPEGTHKISLQTTVLNGFITIEPYYHFSNNLITESGRMRNDSIFEYTFSNAGKYTNQGCEGSIALPFGKKIFLQSGFDFFSSSIKYGDVINKVNDWTMSNQLVFVNEKTGTVAGAIYQKSMKKLITAQGYVKGDNDLWLVFVQQTFFKKRMTVMVGYFPPISFGIDYDQGSYIRSGNYTEERKNNIGPILRNLMIFELSYRFSKGQAAKKTEKNIDTKSEKSNKGLL